MTSLANTREVPYLTSSQVMSEPSSHFTPSFNVNFQTLPPWLDVPVSVARSGTGVVPSVSSSDIENADRRIEKKEAEVGKMRQKVRSMEDEHLPLEESIAAYRRGSELLGHCQTLLKAAEQKVQILENGVLRDFDLASGDAR